MATTWRGMTTLERLAANYIVTDDGCWEWQGWKNWAGYGWTGMNGRRYAAHRAVYLTVVGEIPEGLDLDHLCRNRACVNPDHLEPVTRSENLYRGEVGKHARPDECPKGHPYDEANTYQRKDRPGHRDCRKCRYESHLRWKERNAQ